MYIFCWFIVNTLAQIKESIIAQISWWMFSLWVRAREREIEGACKTGQTSQNATYVHSYLLSPTTNCAVKVLMYVGTYVTKKECFFLAAWSGGIVYASHRGDWSCGSWDRIPLGYRLIAFFKKGKRECFRIELHMLTFNVCVKKGEHIGLDGKYHRSDEHTRNVYGFCICTMYYVHGFCIWILYMY
jgi:hypothetical protein